MFAPLTREEISDIVRMQLSRVIQKTAENDIRINITEGAVAWLAQHGYDPQFGARPIKRLIQKNILNELSRKILEGNVKKEQALLVDSDKNGLCIKNQETGS